MLNIFGQGCNVGLLETFYANNHIKETTGLSEIILINIKSHDLKIWKTLRLENSITIFSFTSRNGKYQEEAIITHLIRII